MKTGLNHKDSGVCVCERKFKEKKEQKEMEKMRME